MVIEFIRRNKDFGERYQKAIELFPDIRGSVVHL
jgi:hypothetical protein